MRKPTLIRLVAAAILIVGSVIGWIYVPRDAGGLREYVDGARHLGVWGPVALAAVYVPATVLLVPGSWLTLGGAFVFGLPRAFVAVSAGSVAGACGAFLVSRYLVRGWVEAKLAANPRFRALDRAVAEQGFRIVFLARLSPLFPFAVLNYAFGATRISFGRYALASWLGMIPGTLLYCYLGAAARELSDLVSRETDEYHWKFFAGLAITVPVTVVITRIAAKALRESVDEEPS